MNSITLLESDITTAEVDAIVNAANPKMLGGGGVDGAIHKAAGSKLLEECRKVKSVNGIRCPFGEARITPGGNLNCKYVIHTAGPIYRNESDPESVLKASYANSLDLALENSCQSIAFPAISCGAYGYPPKSAARVAIETCSMTKYKNLKIYFYLHGNDMFQIWNKACDHCNT